MTYREQLQQPEWHAKRQEILERDGCKCTQCGVKRSQLIGLWKEFGVNDLDGMAQKGYVIQFSSAVFSHETLRARKGNRDYAIEYVGDPFRPVELGKLLFGLKCWSAETPLGLMKNCCTLAFYEEIVREQGLVDLNIHHLYYRSGSKAWEYDNDALTTLCFKCHRRVHETTSIPFYNSENEFVTNLNPCRKCGGSGYLEEYHYYHSGVCFACDGTGADRLDMLDT